MSQAYYSALIKLKFDAPVYLLLCLLLFPAVPHAETEDITPTAGICHRQFLTDEEHWVDRTEDYLSERVCRAGVWFDSFFADPRDLEENVDRFVRVYNQWDWEDGSTMDWRFRINARIQLPGLEERVNLILSDEDEKDLTQTTAEESEAFAPTGTAEVTADEDKKFREAHSLALRWNVVRKPKEAFSIRLKLRLNALLEPSLIARYRYTHGLGQKSLARLTQSAYWTKDEGLGETSRIDLERLLEHQMLLRWSTAATFSENSRGLDWGTGLSLKHSLSDRDAMAYNASVEGITLPNTHATRYRLSMRYRRNFFRPWLFFEVEPSYTWPEDEVGNFHRNAGIMFRLEAHFGRKKI